MSERKWGMITSGATFEALVTTIVRFEDANAALFGRRGRDGGQDVRSGDGILVYQAKHHEEATAAKAIADAKKEAKKIAEYCAPGHSRYEQWKGVRQWRLVTNAEFNPTTRQTWNDEVVPLFKKLGLTADYWERANLDALLIKHPEVDRAFFQNEIRVFLTIPEAREQILLDEPFLQRSASFVGRKHEMKGIRDFLSSDALFLVVHGAGGIGKTRLLLEAGEEVAIEGTWQVLWALVKSMTLAGSWFEAIVPERPTLLLVDEPDDAQLLRVLSEQLGRRVGRTSKWKVAIAVRSPKDPVLRFLHGPRMKSHVKEWQIPALSAEAAENMLIDLLGSGPLASTTSAERRKDAARVLAQRFSQYPVWLTLAVRELEEHGDLSRVPRSAEDLADQYLDEIVKLDAQSSSDQVLALLRWIALIGTVNRDDDTAIGLLASESQIGDATGVKAMVARLVKRRALVQRGARDRLIEVKPDVLRDRLLFRWLSVDVGYGEKRFQPSEDAQKLVAGIHKAIVEGNISHLGHSILLSLARTELLLRLSEQPVPLLDPFFEGIHNDLENLTASARMVLAEVLVGVATFRPADTVALSRALRTSVAEIETIEGLFSNREVGQDDVVLALAWPVFHAAMNARAPDERKQVLEELCDLTQAEAEIATRLPSGLPNEGKRAAAFVRRVLEGGPQFISDFEDAATSIAGRLLDQLATEPPTTETKAVFKALLESAVELDRAQTWYDDNAFHMRKYFVLPDHRAWKTRESIITRVKALLADVNVPAATRKLLWHLFAKAHKSANQCRVQGPEDWHDRMRNLLLDNLTWSRSVLEGRKDALEELSVARTFWHWHCRFEKDPELKAASAQLEALYENNEFAREFEPLVGRNGDWQQRRSRQVAKAGELATAQTPEAIGAFLDRAARFLGSDDKLSRLNTVARNLGSHAQKSEAVREFVHALLANPDSPPRNDFATGVAAGWVAELRRSEPPDAALDLVTNLLKICGNDDQRIRLVQRLYGGPPPSEVIGYLTDAEYNYLRTLDSLFLANGQGPAFISVVGWTLHHEWPAYRALIERILDDIPPEQLPIAINHLVDKIYGAIHESDPAAIPQGLAQWLLEQLLRLPDISGVGSMFDWELKEIIKRAGDVPLSWLPGALVKRRDMEAQDDGENAKAVGYGTRLSQYVAPITEEQVNELTIKKDVESLVDLAWTAGTTGYYLPDILNDIDPKGLVVPEIVGRRIENTTEDDVWRLAKIAGVYAINSPPWRTIAKPTIVAAVDSGSENNRQSLFYHLTEHAPRTFVGTPGEVPALFVSAVESAKKMLESEKDTDFLPFWEWYLDDVEADLRAQEEHAKEERGE